MRHFKILIFLAVATGLAMAQTPLSPNAPEDRPVHSSSTEQHKKLMDALKPYLEQSKKTWPAAKAKYLKGLPAGHVFFVTVELVDMAAKREIVFIEVQKITGDVIDGIIANQIEVVSGYAQGQKYSVKEAIMLDWLISNPDGSEEGNVVGKFLDTYKH